MSRTDNTRPLLLQWWSEGRVVHYHPEGAPCDYEEGNNLFNYRLGHRLKRRWGGRVGEKRCERIAAHTGGEKSHGAKAKVQRKRERRQIRRREHVELCRAMNSKYCKDFDLPVIRREKYPIV